MDRLEFVAAACASLGECVMGNSYRPGLRALSGRVWAGRPVAAEEWVNRLRGGSEDSMQVAVGKISGRAGRVCGWLPAEGRHMEESGSKPRRQRGGGITREGEYVQSTSHPARLLTSALHI